MAFLRAHRGIFEKLEDRGRKSAVGRPPVGQKMEESGSYYSWPGEVDLDAFQFPLFPGETKNIGPRD